MQRLQNRRQRSERGQTTEKNTDREVQPQEGEKRKSKPIIVMRDSQIGASNANGMMDSRVIRTEISQASQESPREKPNMNEAFFSNISKGIGMVKQVFQSEHKQKIPMFETGEEGKTMEPRHIESLNIYADNQDRSLTVQESAAS